MKRRKRWRTASRRKWRRKMKRRKRWRKMKSGKERSGSRIFR